MIECQYKCTYNSICVVLTRIVTLMANHCKQCGRETSNKVFCCVECKAAWQREQKPVTKEWLYQKYVVEGLSAGDIAKIVKRDPTRVYDWLVDFGIPTRPRGHNYASNPRFSFWRSGLANPFQGKRHTEKSKRQMAESSSGPAPWLRGTVHRLFGKRGSASPTWRGGITPERQAFYASPEWKAALKVVWQRDNATCQQCGKRKDQDRGLQFDVHHIVSFANRELRAEPSNLVLLCRPCHLWVHSKENHSKKFLKGE